MKYAILSIAVALAFVAVFIFGVEFGRKTVQDAMIDANARAVSASSYSGGAHYTPTYSSDYTTDYSSGADYTPDK